MSQRARSAASSPVLLAAAAILAIAAQGCVVVSGGARYKETRTASAAHYSDQDLVIESANGSVEVVRADVEGVDVRATLHAETPERLDRMRVYAEGDRGANVLRIGVDWPEDRRGSNEGCDFVVRVADAGRVDVRTSNDEVVIANVGREVEVETSNDEVRVSGIPGPVTVRTSNDDVVLRDVLGPVDVRTSNDDVVVALLPEGTGPVSIVTSNGDVTLAVGPGFLGDLRALTSNGRISMREFRERDDARLFEVGKSSLHVRFGDAAHASVVRSSNGDVEVTTRD